MAFQESSLPSETQEQVTGNQTKTKEKARSLLCDFRFTKQRLELGAGTASDLGFSGAGLGPLGCCFQTEMETPRQAVTDVIAESPRCACLHCGSASRPPGLLWLSSEFCSAHPESAELEQSNSLVLSVKCRFPNINYQIVFQICFAY